MRLAARFVRGQGMLFARVRGVGAGGEIQVHVDSAGLHSGRVTIAVFRVGCGAMNGARFFARTLRVLPHLRELYTARRHRWQACGILQPGEGGHTSLKTKKARSRLLARDFRLSAVTMETPLPSLAGIPEQ